MDSSVSVLSTFVDSIELRGNNRKSKEKRLTKDKQKHTLWAESNI